MKHLIDKSALVAEIRKRLLPTIRDKHYDEWEEGQDSERTAILGILDTLEVKEEVTTDAFIEKAEKWLNEHILDYVYAKEWGQGVGVEGELFDDFKNAMKGE